MLRPLCVFDVDGTIVSTDSLRYLIGRSWRQSPWRAVLLLPFGWVFLATWIFKLDKRWAKSSVLWTLTVGLKPRQVVKQWKIWMEQFAQIYGFREFPEEFQSLTQSAQNEVWFVSASGTFWVRKIIQHLVPPQSRYQVLGSQLGWRWGGVVLIEPNCYHQQKIRKLKQVSKSRFQVDLDQLPYSAQPILEQAYSDHPADLPLFQSARLRHIVCPKPEHLRILKKALEEGHFEVRKWNPKLGQKFP